MEIGNYKISYDKDLDTWNVTYLTDTVIAGIPVYRFVSSHKNVKDAVGSVVDDMVKESLAPKIEELNKIKQTLSEVRKELYADEKDLP